MRIKFIDENSNTLSEFELGGIEEISKEDKITDFQELSDDQVAFLDEFPLYEITSYLPYNDGEDFFVQSMNKKAMIDSGYRYDEIKGSFITKLFYRHDPSNSILKLVREVYKTGKGRHLKAETSENGVLLRFLDIRFIKNKDSIFVLSNDVSDYAFISQQEDKLFEN